MSTCKSDCVQTYKQYISDLLEWIIPASLEFLRKHCSQLCYPGFLNQVKTTLLLTEMILDEAYSHDEDTKNIYSWIQATLIQSGVWGLAGILNNDSRHKFDEFYKLLWKGQNKHHPYPKCLEKLDISIPQEGILFDFNYIYKQRGNWKLWIDILKTQKISESEYMMDFTVPTVETMRYKQIINLHIKNKHNVLIIGPPATGKTLMIEDVLINDVDRNAYDISRIACSISISPSQMQNLILSKLTRRKYGVYTPSDNKKCLIFLEDISSTSIDNFNINCTVEVLRQYFDHNAWYDLATFNPITIEHVNFITKAHLPGGYRQKLSSRFLRHFCVYSINNFSCDTITKIYFTTLQHCWKKSGFPSDTANMATQLTQSTLYIYRQIQNHFKPNINQCHYVFNLRDFTRVIKSCLFLRKDTYDSNKKIYMKIWTHEILRTFGDRMNTQEDHDWLFGNIKHCFQEYFEENINEIFENLLENEEITIQNLENLIFGFNGEVDNQGVQRYEEQTNITTLLETVNTSLMEFNKSNRVKLNITVFKDSILRLVKLSRILKSSPGNALLIGISGSGRRNLTKLASYINNIKFMQPNITMNYSGKDWNDQIKSILKESGGFGNQVVFLLREQDILHDQFLENINFLLKGSEIPILYNPDERQEILELVRLDAQGGNRNVDISSSSVFLFFHKRCLLNLHLFICLNPSDSKLSKRLSMYPYLTNSNVIWWNDWPDQYFEDVAKVFIKDVNVSDELKTILPKIFVNFHRYIQIKTQVPLKYHRMIHITTSHYAHMVNLFVKLIHKKQQSLSETKHNYTLGLNKLSYAANQILDMQKSLAEYQPQLEEMTQKAAEMTKQIALETIEVEKASALVRTDEKVAHQQAEVAQILKSECEAELAQAIPILEDAISALNTLKPSDITLVKSMKNPPDAIKLVMAAVCVIKDVKPDRIPDPSTGRKTLDYWGPSKRILGDMNFLQTLKEFDKDNIKPEIMVKIRKDYLPHKDFKPHVVAKASSAAEGLCKWIIAMDMYDKVAKEVAPKKEKLEKAEREYSETMRVLNEKKDEVARIEEKLASLNELLLEARQKQQTLQKEVDVCKEKLRKAQKLIGGLSGEKIRWMEISEKLQYHYDCLTGDILLSSAHISYLAGFVKCERNDIINNWYEVIKERDVPISNKYSFEKVIGSDRDIGTAQMQGLLNDSIFVENYLILKNTMFYPLFIDPQYSAKNWVNNKEKNNNCIRTRLTENYIEKIITAIELGRPVLIYNVGDDIPLNLMSFLEKQMIVNGEVFYFINERKIKVHKNFRFYMFTNKHNPHYPPVIWNRLTIINFYITKTALTEMLLNIIIEIEKPEFKKLKADLSKQLRKNEAEIKQLEEKILYTLTESETDILEDESSIVILQESKDMAKKIRLKQEDTKQLQMPILEFKKEYVDVAEHACSIYYCIKDLFQVHYLYQYSLEWFVDVYFQSIINASTSRLIEERRRSLKLTFTYSLYLKTAESMYNKDRLLLAFLIASNILINEKKVSRDEYWYFLFGECNFKLQEENPLPTEISKSKWSGLCHLYILPCFQGFREDLIENIAFWNDFLTCNDPFSVPLPGEWNDRLNSFQKLILIKLLRPEKLYNSLPKFVEKEIGDKFTEPIEMNINAIYNKSYNLQPIIFIVTGGENPLKELEKLVYRKQYKNKFFTISLGPDCCEKASDMMEAAKLHGSWIFLQNCQFSSNFLFDLESNIEGTDFQSTHENFRLWLSVEPFPEIPETLLQNSIKIINEPPQSLRQKLIKLYKEDPIIDESFYRGCPGKHALFARLLYGLAFFHSKIQQRQKIYSLDAPYLFSDKDFLVSVRQLQSIINEPNFTFKKLIYIIGTCNYGGYVGSNYGKKLVKVLLKECVNKDAVKNTTFTFNNVLNYGLPNKNDHQDFMHYIEKLPANDMPEIFGLNPNTDVRKGLQYKTEFFASLLNASRLNQRNTIHNNETLILCIVSEVLCLLPDCLQINNQHVEDFKYFVVCKEIKQYNLIIKTVRKCMEEVRHVLEGHTTINCKIQTVMERLLNDEMPDEWLVVTKHVCHKLSHFLQHFSNNLNYIKRLSEGTIQEYEVAAHFYPKALLWALKVNYSKKYNVDLEKVVLENNVLKVNNMEDCLKISSLYLANASWNFELNQLEENLSNKVYTVMPPIVFKPILEEKVTSDKKYKCQVYHSDQKKDRIFEKDCNYIMSVFLNTGIDPAHWMKRGVVLYCNIDMD